MKTWGAVLAVLLLLTGCSSRNQELDRAMDLRSRALQAPGCTFDAEITADYGDTLYTFSVSCQWENSGSLTFTVTQPESISGITGTITRESGALTFEDVALQFDTLTDGQVTPVMAPWILMQGLTGGYLTSAGMEDGFVRVSVDDNYAGEALHLDVWLSGQDLPIRGEILYDGRRIVSLSVKNFALL